jgi:methionyl-tRNA synthetase
MKFCQGGFEMKGKNTYYITTPIYYPSDKLHIGNTYTTVAADAAARFKRLTGYDVMFLTGTDEHGQKIQRIAESKGVTPKEYVDKIVAGIKDLWQMMDISYDKFIRTTDDYHEQAVQRIFEKLYEQGDIYKGYYEGLYCTPCEAFWTETQAVGGKCPDCGRPVELTKEEAYFFKLSKYQDRLLKYIEDHPDFIQPESRKNEMINNFLKPGLEDLCVSRTSFSWGIPVTFDKKHVVYVWVDALPNYITALGYASEDDTLYKKFWPADLHLVGKEIVRFHTIIWPVMLMALGEPIPEKVFGHGWLVFDGDKMSKSKGNVVDPRVLAARYGVDAVRYYLMREMAFGSDGNFTNMSFINRINSDLANDLGNLVSRTVAMVEKYFNGELPNSQTPGEYDEDLKALAMETTKKVEETMNNFQFNVALTEIWKFISRTNKYIDETMPWALARDEEKRPRLARVLYNLCESIRIIGVLVGSFIPRTSQKILHQIGIEDKSLITWESINKWGEYPSQTKVNKAEMLFPRLDVEKELEALSIKKEEPKVEEPKNESKELITIDEFDKIDLRVAKVLKCEKVEGSVKLLKFELQLGSEIRQVVSGIAKYYEPEDLIGKNVVMVYNLKPAKLKGIESQGMIIAAGEGDTISLLTTDKDFESGATIS